MKYLYKKTGAVVESGIRLNPAIFEPITEKSKNISVAEVAAAVKEEDSAMDVVTEENHAENVSTVAEATNVSPVKTSAKVSATQKKTVVKKTVSTKK